MGLKSECVCVVTQGWLSHKMLPLAGKRGMAWCRNRWAHGTMRHCMVLCGTIKYGVSIQNVATDWETRYGIAQNHWAQYAIGMLYDIGVLMWYGTVWCVT